MNKQRMMKKNKMIECVKDKKERNRLIKVI